MVSLLGTPGLGSFAHQVAGATGPGQLPAPGQTAEG